MSRSERSHLESTLAHQLRMLGLLDLCEAEYRFSAYHVGGPGRGLRARLLEAGLSDWRFDLAWPPLKLAVEIEGGLYVGGRHTRGAGFEEDLRKYDAAMRLGWDVYRCGKQLIKSGQASATISTLIGLKRDYYRNLHPEKGATA